MAQTRFLTFERVYFVQKSTGKSEDGQNAIIKGTNQTNQKTQRGEWGQANLYMMMGNEERNLTHSRYNRSHLYKH